MSYPHFSSECHEHGPMQEMQRRAERAEARVRDLEAAVAAKRAENDSLRASVANALEAAGIPRHLAVEFALRHGVTASAGREVAAPVRDPRCRCGSGAHPRRCEVHPHAYDRHVLELNYENVCEELAESQREVAALRRVEEAARFVQYYGATMTAADREPLRNALDALDAVRADATRRAAGEAGAAGAGGAK